MEAPYSIASLPRPLDHDNGQTYAASVYAFKGSKKRKRHEVAIAVDGEGLSIYNVQSQVLVTSYAIPPQSYFCCQPCSVYTRPTDESPAERRTYVVLKDGAGSRSRKLICFTETARGRKGADGDYELPKRLECAIPDGEICSLDTIASAVRGPSKVIITYSNGRVVLLPGDMSQVHEQMAAFRVSSGDEIEHSTVLDYESVEKGLLKDRHDVRASLAQNGTGTVRDDFLLQIVRSKTHRRIDLCLLRGFARNKIRATQAHREVIMSVDIPRAGRKTAAHARHEVHAASGTLYSIVEGTLCVYDLASTLPKLVIELGGQSDPIISFARLTKSLVVTVSPSTAKVYDTAYGSLQASGSLQIFETANEQSKKRKRESDGLLDARSTTRAISVSAEAGYFSFISGSQFAAIQFGEDIVRRIQGKERPARLTDVLGYGSQKASSDKDQAENKTSFWTAQVDSLIEDHDIEGLESLVANDDGLGRQRKPHAFGGNGLVDEAGDNTDAAAYDDLWPLPELLDPTKLDRRHALYLLGKVFSYAPDQAQIEVRVASRKLLEWFALAGFLNRQALERALLPDGAGAQREPIRPGHIVTAISEVDDEFQLMHVLLSLPAQWDLGEVIQAMCLLIRSFDATPASDEHAKPQLALLGAPIGSADHTMTNGDIDMVDGHADSHLESESKAAESELEHVERILMSGLEVRSDTLRVILERLHAFPALTVTKSMRAMMTQKELIFLIHMLRIELADGGWTSRYTGAGTDEEKHDAGSDPLLASMVDFMPSDGETGPSNQAIRAISDLLNCAVDAVGTSGWLVGLSGDALGTEELLDSLRTEVSAGLEGCYEANTMGTFLAELERFLDSKPKQRNGRTGEGLQAPLPVGGKAQPSLPNNRRSTGKKSKQVIALEKSKKVGKYSLDRIRF